MPPPAARSPPARATRARSTCTGSSCTSPSPERSKVDACGGVRHNGPMRLSLLLAAALAATVVPPSLGAPSAKKRYTIKVLSLTRVSIPHDLKPKGTEKRGDYIEVKDLSLTTATLLGKRANQPMGFDQGTLTYTSASTARL